MLQWQDDSKQQLKSYLQPVLLTPNIPVRKYCWSDNMVVVCSSHVLICSSRALSSSKDVSTAAMTRWLKTKLSRHTRLMYATTRLPLLLLSTWKDVSTVALTLVAARSSHLLNHLCHHVLWPLFNNIKVCKFCCNVRIIWNGNRSGMVLYRQPPVPSQHCSM
jgi:hypothetical protein